MKKTKVFFILFLVLAFSIVSFTCVKAHSVELDPEGLISFPWIISNGKGTISISSSQTGYSLYYQAIEIPNSDYSQIEEIETSGKDLLEDMETKLNSLSSESDSLKTKYENALKAWQEKVENDASEDEITEAENAYKDAETEYNNKIDEYNAKVTEYNNKVNELNDSIKALIPTYIEENWIETTDGNFSVDLSQFSGNKAFAIWAKLVTSDGSTYYDEGNYSMSGTKAEEIAVDSITLNETSITLAVGDSYTLVATIEPSNATNKSINWESDNEDVVTVEDGKVTAISEGTATVTATSVDGEFTASCDITVEEKSTTPTDDNQNTQDTQNNQISDPTVAPGKLPQTGNQVYIILLAIVILSVISFVAYKKVKYLNFK